jgi:hypothetical protein
MEGKLFDKSARTTLVDSALADFMTIGLGDHGAPLPYVGLLKIAQDLLRAVERPIGLTPAPRFQP